MGRTEEEARGERVRASVSREIFAAQDERARALQRCRQTPRADRPTACRYYPLGVGALQHKEGADDDGFFFFINEPHCKGFEEKKEWTVAEWRKDQGVDIHDEINAEWTDLVVRKRSFPPNIQLTEQAKKMFFMASYDVDAFRRFVFESSFLSRYDIDPGTMERIRSSEIELLKFGFRWLKSILFKGEGFTVKK